MQKMAEIPFVPEVKRKYSKDIKQKEESEQQDKIVVIVIVSNKTKSKISIKKKLL